MGTITCLAKIDENSFCCGTSYSKLFVFDYSGNVLHEMTANNEEIINCILPIKNGMIALGLSSPGLFAYKMNSKTLITATQILRESVTCLKMINDDEFVSGSYDGSVYIWDTHTLNPVRLIYCPQMYKVLSSEKNNLYRYLYPVHSIKIISDIYIAACLGNSFKVWNKNDGTKVYDIENAHEQSACDIISLYNGRTLVTCGGDALVKLWVCDPPLQRFEKRNNKRNRKVFQKLGVMRAHPNQIQFLIKINEHSFVSIGKDNLVIFWRDGTNEQIFRDKTSKEMRQSLQYEKELETTTNDSLDQ